VFISETEVHTGFDRSSCGLLTQAEHERIEVVNADLSGKRDFSGSIKPENGQQLSWAGRRPAPRVASRIVGVRPPAELMTGCQAESKVPESCLSD
jgi:hypothetical protein